MLQINFRIFWGFPLWFGDIALDLGKNIRKSPSTWCSVRCREVGTRSCNRGDMRNFLGSPCRLYFRLTWNSKFWRRMVQWSQWASVPWFFSTKVIMAHDTKQIQIPIVKLFGMEIGCRNYQFLKEKANFFNFRCQRHNTYNISVYI